LPQQEPGQPLLPRRPDNQVRVRLPGGVQVFRDRVDGDGFDEFLAGGSVGNLLAQQCADGVGDFLAAAVPDRALLSKELANGASAEELVEAVTVDAISENLYTSGQPDPDLVIRTSGEQRLSGFLLWQSAYSEMWFTEAHWPAFRRVDFLRALRDYSLRHRRYGI
jgi:hypothetical protein